MRIALGFCLFLCLVAGFRPSLASAGWSMLELGSANYGTAANQHLALDNDFSYSRPGYQRAIAHPEELGNPRLEAMIRKESLQYNTLFNAVDKMIATRGPKGTIYLNDLFAEDIGGPLDEGKVHHAVVGHLQRRALELRKRGIYLDVDVRIAAGSYTDPDFAKKAGLAPGQTFDVVAFRHPEGTMLQRFAEHPGLLRRLAALSSTGVISLTSNFDRTISILRYGLDATEGCLSLAEVDLRTYYHVPAGQTPAESAAYYMPNGEKIDWDARAFAIRIDEDKCFALDAKSLVGNTAKGC